MKLMRTIRLKTPGLRTNQHRSPEIVEESRGPASKRNARKKWVLLSIALGILMMGSIASVVGYLALSGMYHRDMALAQTGVQHLQKAENLITELPTHPLDTNQVSQAQREFAAGLTALAQVNHDLQSLPGFSTAIPIYGSRLGSALRLLPIAIGLAQVGMTGCSILNLLISRFHNPLAGQGEGLTESDLNEIGQNLHSVQLTVDGISAHLEQLQPADLQVDPRISTLLVKLRSALPGLRAGLSAAEQFMSVAPTLLGIGAPANYLVEVLDSTELRPGGGFIGNYGIASLSAGRLTSVHLTDVYLLDNPFFYSGQHIPFPPQYQWFPFSQSKWGLRDSNLDADFPTVARYGEQYYSLEGGTDTLQGVIAITPAFMQQTLAITGPIRIPEFGEVVTAQNLIDLIHYHLLASDPSLGEYYQGKYYTEILAEHFMARIHQLPASALSKVWQLLLNALHTKDLQIYLNADKAEQILTQYHLDDSIQKPTGAVGDSLMVVDANFSHNKANSVIVNTLSDQVFINTRGDVQHQTTLTYSWTAKENVYGPGLYQDYVRVYTPSSSVLLKQDGWKPQGTSIAFGNEVWAGWFELAYGQTRSITLTWVVPHAAKNDANGWHYHLLIQRQAGAIRMLQLHITLPSCAVPGSTGGVDLSRNKQGEMLVQPLNENLNVAVNYTCR